MDDTSDVTERRGGFDECVHGLARGHVDGCGAHVKASVGQHLGRRFGVGLVEIRKQDVLTCADPAGDRLADLSRSDDDNDVAHKCSFSGAALASRTVTA